MSDKVDLCVVEKQLQSFFKKYAQQDVLDEAGLLLFWRDLGVMLEDRESREVYELVIMAAEEGPEKEKKKVTLEVIVRYLIISVLRTDIGDNVPGRILHRLLMAEEDDRCPIKAKLLVEHLWQMQSDAIRADLRRQIERDGDVSELLSCLELAEVPDNSLCVAAGGQFTRSFSLESTAKNLTEEDRIQRAKKLKEFFADLHRRGLTGLEKIEPSKFRKLKREGQDESIAMKEDGQPASPVNIGLHSLTQLYDHCGEPVECVIPEYASMKAHWDEKGKTLTFPEGFSEKKIPKEIATPQSLKYYNCAIANYNQEEVLLFHAGHIHNFTYAKDYLDNFVQAESRGQGATLERHNFPHLDCPKDKKSGELVIGKYVKGQEEGEEELHLTGFVVPVGQMVYIPDNVIHTNDYLQGTWITMLSQPNEPADQVKLVEGKAGKRFHFRFSELQI